MAEHSKIEWTDHTWNPWIGCTRVSAACDNCYAATLSHRYGWARFEAGAPRHRTSAEYWQRPLHWNRKAQANGVRTKIFPSLCDPFDAEVDEAWRQDLIDIIGATPWLIWLLLTKRPQVAAKAWAGQLMPPNIWLGVTAENQAMADLRIPQLLKIPATKRFLSCEPLLGPLDIYNGDPDPRLNGHRATRTYIGEWWEPGDGRDAPPRVGVDWVIAGGESGPGSRPSSPNWFLSLRDQCAAAGVPFFFKQQGLWQHRLGVKNVFAHHWPDGSWSHKCQANAHHAEIDGREHREFPE